MSIDTQIVEALSGLVDGRVYPDYAPAGAGLPRIVYQQVGGDSLNYEEGTTPDRENCRVQVTTWGTRRLEVTALAKLVETTLVAVAELQVEKLGNRASLAEGDTGPRGARQDFSIWVDR